MTVNTQTFVNGKIFTSRSEDDFATAFTIEDGKFSWVGDASEVQAENAIDLEGKTVLPGLIDVHTHPTYVAMTIAGVPCTVPYVHNIDEMLDALRNHPNMGKDENTWIEGWGYDESKLEEHRTPTRHDLDKVSTTQPIHVLRSDCHSGICNTRALELAGITAETPDPEGAKFGRDEDGTPNGVLQEHGANDFVMRAKQNPDYNAAVDAIYGSAQHYYERGITAVTDMMVFTEPFDKLEVYRDAEKKGFKLQAPLYFGWSEYQDTDLPTLTDARKDGRTKFAGVKLFADGSVSGRTAWVSQAYKGEPDNHGYPTITDEEMQAAYEYAKANGVQVSVHVMGDLAIDRVINFFNDKEPWMGEDIASVRMEHLTLLSREQMTRMREGKMIWGGSTQIIFFFAEYDSYSASLTDEQYKATYPVKDYYEGFPYFGLSADAPATTWADPDNVFVSIQAAVTRKAYNGADIVASQAITVPQAVLLYTARPAHVAPYEGKIGQINEGYEASFTVIDTDIFTADVNTIADTNVEQTWIAGENVYTR